MTKEKKWEVVCKRCFSGFLMLDEEAKRRVGNERLWPKHCGEIMSLRNIDPYRGQKIECSHFGCHQAQNARCACDCEGRFHGAKLDYIPYERPIIAPKPWWKSPIKIYLTHLNDPQEISR